MLRSPRLLIFALSLAICGWCVSASAAVKLPAVIGSDMVLQQGMPLPIWGWADKGEVVTVTVAGQSHTANAGDDGRWEVKLGKLDVTPEDKPLTMTIKGATGEPITLKNILVGEVWVCSGQSNMEMGVGAAKNGREEIAAADHPGIRLFMVTKARAKEPAKDVKATWAVCSPKTLGAGGWAGFSAAGYYFGRELHKELKVPVGLVFTSWGGTSAEQWTSKPALEAEPTLKGMAGKGENSTLYNAMIAPLVPLAVRGAVWYQGEANVGRGKQYEVLLPAMIRDWRTAWAEGDFPFGIVQIAPYNYGGDGVAEAELWEAQLKTAQNVPNTGIALTMDIGELKDIHPKDKQDVGHRLALWALAKVYDRPVVYSGPIFKSMTVEGDRIRIALDHVGGGLISRDGKPLSEFAIAGADKKFQPAAAEIDGATVVVHSDAVPNPVAVRFAFHGTAEPNLANKEGIPAAPFRTDK